MGDNESLGWPGSEADHDRGRVEDAPWALTLAALGKSGRTGQITVRTTAGKVHAIAFSKGSVIGASSPMAVDTVARIATSLRLPAAAVMQSGPRRRPNGADPEVEAYVVAAKLTPDQIKDLKHRLLVQRAARTFAVEKGVYTVEDRVTIPIVLGVEVDVRAVVFAGALLHVEGGRMAAELAGVGSRFAFADDAAADLAKFEFGDTEKPVIAELRVGTSVPEVEARHREVDPRRVQAVFYALATCGALVKLPAREGSALRGLAMGSVSLEKLDTPTGMKWIRLPTNADAIDPAVPTLFEHEHDEDSDQQAVPMLIRQDVEVSVQAVGHHPERTPTRSLTPVPMPIPMRARISAVPPPPPGARGTASPPSAATGGHRSMTDPFLEARPTTLRPNALTAAELRELIASRSEAIEHGADHFAVLGIPIASAPEAVRAAYIELARNLRNERLIELRIQDQEFLARSLSAQICIAYTVLTDPVRRVGYMTGLQRATLQPAADLDFDRISREAFERGSRALRADDFDLAVAELRTACELAPNDIRYLATLGHAEFCAAAATSRITRER